jgi:hypothetical protein
MLYDQRVPGCARSGSLPSLSIIVCSGAAVSSTRPWMIIRSTGLFELST